MINASISADPVGVQGGPAALKLTDGAIEMLKWLGLLCMTLDHMNRVIFGSKYPFLSDIGRLALPLFGFVLASNLARPGGIEKGAYRRAAMRLCAFGLVSTPFYMVAFKNPDGWWPLNVMFLFLIFVGIVWTIESGSRYRFFGVALFIVAGALVEYWWIGLIYCLAAWWVCKLPTKTAMMMWIAAMALLYFVNGNLWALAALPIVFLSQWFDIKVGRHPYIFYVFYPLHIAVLFSCKNFLLL